ncbi:MAG: hypothetical protein K0U36_04430 [Alphaproteobacteria bacterium]|nr:hypothetical protein [Alphaproteobacteria bacterium]
MDVQKLLARRYVVKERRPSTTEDTSMIAPVSRSAILGSNSLIAAVSRQRITRSWQ